MIDNRWKLDRRRVVRALLAMGTAGLLAGCAGCSPRAETDGAPDGRLNVVTSLFPYYDFARQIGGEEIDLSLLDAARVFHFGTLSLTDEPARSATRAAVAYARERGALLTFDPNLRPPLWRNLEEAREQMLWGLGQADVVKISDEEVRFLFQCGPEAGAERLHREMGVPLVFVTCGGEGCFFHSARAHGHEAGLSALQVVDTTGAGDIFGGSAVWKLLQTGKAPQDLSEAELRGIVRFACTAAGLSTTKQGGLSSIPTLEQVQARLAEESRA